MNYRRWLLVLAFAALAAALVFAGSLARFYVGQATDRGGYFSPTIGGPEYFRLGLRTQSEAFPTRTVSRGGAIAELPAAPGALEAVEYEYAGERRPFAEFLARNHTHGIVVLHRGGIVYERYFAGASERSRFTSWSVAKSVTATLVGIALGEGRIRGLGDPLGSYVPGLGGTAYEEVTIEQALRMRSGVAFTEEYTDGGSDVADFMRGSVIEQRASADALAAAYPRGAEPGSVFNYNTAETQILGWLVRAVNEGAHAAVLEEKLWRPLGMEHDATILLDRPGSEGVEMAGCCLNATLRDWARFGQLHLQDGVWQGRRLLPEGWVARATQSSASATSDDFYGYQWWLFEGGRYAAEGVHGQFIFVDPAHALVVAKASYWPVAWDEALADEALSAFGAIARVLQDAD